MMALRCGQFWLSRRLAAEPRRSRLSRMCVGLVGVLSVTGCASDPEILPVISAGTPGASVEHVLVATSRRPNDNELVLYAGDRSSTLNFAEIAVSVPPDREPGTISYPNSKPDPKRQFAPLRAHTGLSRGQFLSKVNSRLEALPENEQVVFIFVHGYNTDFPESVYRHAQILHDFDVPGAAITFSWPSAGDPALYLYDHDSAQFSASRLAETLSIIASSKARSIILMGHSMGAALTMGALRELSLRGDKSVLRRVDALVLAAPDIDVDVFSAQVAAIDPLPKHFLVLVSRKDRALEASRRLHGGRPRVGEGANIDDLRGKGIYVFDLTGESGQSDQLKHNTFATSPTLIAVAQSGLVDHGNLADKKEFGKALGVVSDILVGVVYLPAKVAGVR